MKIVSCLILLLVNSQIPWANSLLSVPWSISISAEHGSSDTFISCKGVLSSPTQVIAPTACIKQLPRNSQLLLKAEEQNYISQTRLALRVSVTDNFAMITVNPFELNNDVQTLTALIGSCNWSDLYDAFALSYAYNAPNRVSVRNLNFTNSVEICDELNLIDPRVTFYLHRCIRLSHDECELFEEPGGGGEVLVTKSDTFGAFELNAFKLFHDCEQNVAVYSNLCLAP